jgi:ABC-2 type transport system ATP-binding protein
LTLSLGAQGVVPMGETVGSLVEPTNVPAIHLAGLVKRYRRVTALAGLTLTVARGEVFGFLGPNGAGKTTAVKLLLGLAHPTSGEGYVLGAPLGDLGARKQIGYLPELFRYQEWLSAQEVLALHCSLARMPRHAWNIQIDEALALVGLTSRAHDRVGTFSKGMQQRLGLGVALLGNPQLVVLDEPTSALDPVGRHDVREIIHALKARGATVFLNSHLLTEVEYVCDRVAVVDRGHVIAVSRVSDLTEDVHSVRIRCSTLSDAQLSRCSAYGELILADGWYTAHGMDANTVPDLVAALVAVGARIYAVEPGRQTLEQRFLEILKGSQDARAGHRAPDPV